MKHLLSTLAVALVAAFVCGCSGGSSEVALTVSASAIELPANGGTKSITVTSGADLVATPSKSWCTAKIDLEKQTLSVTAKKNYAAKQRTAEITLTSGSQSQVVAITQKAGTGKIDAFTLSSLAFPELYPTNRGEVRVKSTEGNYIIMITLTDPIYPWRVEITEGDFVSTKFGSNQKGSGYFSFDVEANNTPDEREAKLTIISEYEGAKCTYDLTVIQEATHRIQDPIVAPKIEW